MEDIRVISDIQYNICDIARKILSILWNNIYEFSKHLSKEKQDAEEYEKVNIVVTRILQMYEDDILRLAYSYLHNMQEAEDIVQETLIKYWEKAPVNMDAAQEKAWLFTVASNLSKNRIRYKKLRATDELLDSLIQEKREDLSFVWEAVRSLPVKYREVIHLFYYDGYTSNDIARILKRNNNSVRSDLSRGREQLKKILKEAYDFE